MEEMNLNEGLYLKRNIFSKIDHIPKPYNIQN